MMTITTTYVVRYEPNSSSAWQGHRRRIYEAQAKCRWVWGVTPGRDPLPRHDILPRVAGNPPDR